MEIDVFQRRDLSTVFRALRTALRTSGPLEPREQRFLQTYARIVNTPLKQADPEPIAADQVTISGGHQRKRLVQLCALAVLLSHPVRPESLSFLRSLARHLGTWDSVIDAIGALTRGQHLRVRVLTMRRGLRALLKEAYAAEGAPGVLRFLGALYLGIQVNKDRVWDYKRLGLLPEGTLGREYWKHMANQGFGFPGEPGGIPDSVAYHDIAHVLAGHDTTPLGEIQQGSFQGGNRREDGFFFVQFVVLHFHHGVQITPMAPPQFGNFHPEKVLWAIHRGANCNVDVTHQWNYWPLMSLPVEKARESVGMLPKLSRITAEERDLRAAA